MDRHDQVRSYEVTGNKLTITSRLIDPASGKEAQYVVLWEKVEGPRCSVTERVY
jgi:hypothetical protein